MRAFVVYESMFGNTEKVARAVAEGLGAGMDVELQDVATATLGGPVDLIVAGGPTHAFSLSSTSTRTKAKLQGATRGSERIGLREWLGMLPAATRGQSFAAFDTRSERVRRLPGSAAAKAARIALRLGYAPVGRQSFFVVGSTGPLVDGEIERAKVWGARLASQPRTTGQSQTAR